MGHLQKNSCIFQTTAGTLMQLYIIYHYMSVTLTIYHICMKIFLNGHIFGKTESYTKRTTRNCLGGMGHPGGGMGHKKMNGAL